MRNRTFRLLLLMSFLATGACFAQIGDVQIGTWKLDPARSKLIPYMGRNDIVDVEWSLFKRKVTISGVDTDGHAMHSEWRGKFDGQDYPVTGDPTSDMRSYAKVNDHTLNFRVKRRGQVVATGTVVVSPDGKSRTATAWVTRHKKKVKSVAVYVKAK